MCIKMCINYGLLFLQLPTSPPQLIVLVVFGAVYEPFVSSYAGQLAENLFLNYSWSINFAKWWMMHAFLYAYLDFI